MYLTCKQKHEGRDSQPHLPRCDVSQASDEAEEDEDIGALAAFGCLRALSTVLESVSRLPHMFPQLEEILFPIMQAMCSEDGQDVFEEILEMIAYFTYFSPEVSHHISDFTVVDDTLSWQRSVHMLP